MPEAFWCYTEKSRIAQVIAITCGDIALAQRLAWDYLVSGTNKRPNILFLFSDQHSAQTLGCYGNSQISTPNLDALASTGVRLENAYCNNPICTPSRMCYLSGQYAHNHGRFGLMGPNPQDLPSLFTHFKSHGYRTGMTGKIHTPSGWLSKDCDFVADGYGHENQASIKPPHRIEGAQGSSQDLYYDYLESKGLRHERDDKIIPEWNELHPNHIASQGLDARPSRLHEDDTIEAWCAAQTNRFLEQSTHEKKPFCFWMTVPRPHTTYLPAKKFWDLYPENLPLPPNSSSDLSHRHSSVQKRRKELQDNTDWMAFEPKTWDAAQQRVLRGYYGCVSQVDDAVGRVMTKLEQLGLREDTIVVYSTDHGEFAGEHGLVEKAPGIGFRCVSRVPSLWSWPGKLPEGVVRKEIYESVDFIPTVCSLAGLPPLETVDGKDASSMLRSGTAYKEIAVTENPLTKTIHTTRFKLTQYHPDTCEGRDFGELYDIENDPWELNNLYFLNEYKNIAKELQLKLYHWLTRTTRVTTQNPSAPMMNGIAPDLAGIGAGGKAMTSWDNASLLRGSDGKCLPEVQDELIRRGQMNYL